MKLVVEAKRRSEASRVITVVINVVIVVIVIIVVIVVIVVIIIVPHLCLFIILTCITKNKGSNGYFLINFARCMALEICPFFVATQTVHY